MNNRLHNLLSKSMSSCCVLCYVICYAFLCSYIPAIADESRIYHFNTKYGAYKVEIKPKATEGNRLVISKGDKTLVDTSEHNYFVVDPTSEEVDFAGEPKVHPKLFDLNADGYKDLIIESWTGGAHCCYTYDIYSLGPAMKRIFHQFTQDGHLSIAFPKHQLPVLEVQDATLRWSDVYEFPVMKMRWRAGKFRMAPDAMRRHVSIEELNHLRATMRAKANDRRLSDSEVYESAMRLYFSGNGKFAHNLLQEFQPATYKALLKQFQRSPYYRDILLLNGGHL